MTYEELIKKGAKATTTSKINPQQKVVTQYMTGGSKAVSELPEGVGFMERLKMSFGDEETQAKKKELEEQLGLRGKLDWGDIADVAGAVPEFAGGIIGGIFGNVGGAALGVGAGSIVKRGIGSLLGVRDESLGREALGVAADTGMAYVGGKVLNGIFNVATKTIPNKFMATIFKQSSDDIANEVRSGGKNIVQSQEVLNEGFKGNARKMMEFAVKTMDDLETQAQATVSGKIVDLPNKKAVINTISHYVSKFKPLTKFGGNEIKPVTEGLQLLKTLKSVKGNKISGETVLQARRFLDGVRRTSSFKKNTDINPNMQEIYKSLANKLRQQLAKQVPELGKIMKRYTIHINAFEDLSKYAAKTQNKDLLDLLDVFIMYGINPSAYLARRGLTSAAFKSYTAQALHQAGKITEKVLPKGTIPSLMGGEGEDLINMFTD